MTTSHSNIRRFPLARIPIAAAVDMNFDLINFTMRCVVPLPGHVGSFGHVRTKHIHEGIDLYGNYGEVVYAIEDGFVKAVFPFTGPQVDMPWWNDTWAMHIVDSTGSWVYGEIEPYEHLVGTHVTAGQAIGKLLTVLKKDKGRPRSMLHLERWDTDTPSVTFQWLTGQPKPEFLQDPTPLILEIFE